MTINFFFVRGHHIEDPKEMNRLETRFGLLVSYSRVEHRMNNRVSGQNDITVKRALRSVTWIKTKSEFTLRQYCRYTSP